MNIIFMGTPDFAEESLKAIYNAGHNILAVVTNPDKPKGRGMKKASSPVKIFAEEKNIPIFQPQKVRNNEEFIEEIKKLNPEVLCVVAYGKILPKELLEIPKYGSINVHASLLPKYRGAAPIQWAILNGDEKTGITTMYMDEGMDTGDIILKQEIKIEENETTGELWDKLKIIGGKLLVKTLEEIKNGTAPRIKQGENYTLAPMLDKKMAQINWEEQNAKQIKNLVRGLNPIIGAYTFYENKKIKFWKVEIVENKQELEKEKIKNIKEKKLGEILIANPKEGLYIKAKEGIIKVLEIQGENAKRMNIKEYLLGNKIEEGMNFRDVP